MASEEGEVAEGPGCHRLHRLRVALEREDEQGDVGGLHVELRPEEAVQPKDADRLLPAGAITCALGCRREAWVARQLPEGRTLQSSRSRRIVGEGGGGDD